MKRVIKTNKFLVMTAAVLITGISLTLVTNVMGAETIPSEVREQADSNQTTVVQEESSVREPGLADIVPLAAELSGRLATLQNSIEGGPDVNEIEKRCGEIDKNLKNLVDSFQRLRDSKYYRYSKVLEFSSSIRQENRSLEEISEPLKKEINQIESWRNEWLTEKKKWSQWQSSLLKAEELDLLKSTFEKANGTIDSALNIIVPKIQAMLRAQEQAGTIQVKINDLTAELDGILLDERRSVFDETSPPMFSREYTSQFSSDLFYSVQRGINGILWPDSRFFNRQGWIILTQVFLALFVIISVYRRRTALKELEQWRFIVERPFSVGLFCSCIATILLYAYQGAPTIWRHGIIFVAGVSFARISSHLVQESWKKRFVYTLVIVFILTKILNVLNFPLPLYRLYTVVISLIGFVLCLWWTRQSINTTQMGLYRRMLYLGCLFFVVIVIAELWGKESLASYLFVSLIDSVGIVLVLMLFMYIVRRGLEWFFRHSALRRAAALYSDDADIIIRRVSRFVDAVIFGLILLPGILVIWGVYDGFEEATKGLWTLGFKLGSQRISIGLIITSAGILYGSLLVSWMLQKLLMDEVFVRRRMERGVRLSMARLIHYVIVFIGFVLAISIIGFDVTKLTIILSALGVGVGFGLQGIVNNFVSGLILLFERPVRVGDIVEIGGKWAEIRKIGLRSTTVKTFDEADVIIPNSELISNRVTNWTLTNRLVRLIIPVGVAYGSDVPLVIETLMACAKTNSNVAQSPPPQVLFLRFGESSLDFELRVWTVDADYIFKVTSELHQEIDRRFREANIVIAFPQRDLHLRSVDESVNLRTSEKNNRTRKQTDFL